MEKDHVANNEPNGEDDEDEGSDGWCVNRLFHSGEAGEAAYEKAAVAFEKGMNGLDWELDIGDSFFCELDDVVAKAYEAGKKQRSAIKPVRKTKKKMTEVNKSEEIRKVAAELKVKGETVRPKSIIDILKKRGIKVVPPQVSIVLKNAGYRPAGKSRKRASKAVKPADSGKVSAPAGKSGSVNIDELLVAKKFAVGFGGVEKAIAALNALNRLS